VKNPCSIRNSEKYRLMQFDEPLRSCDEHLHDGFIIYYCQRGKFTHTVSSESAILTHGDICFLPPNTMHSISINAPQTVIYMLEFQHSTGLSDIKNNYPKLTLPPDEIVFFECVLARIVHEYNHPNVESEEIIRNIIAAMSAMLSRLYAAKANSKSLSGDKHNFIEYCISYIDAHCTENITLDDITKLSTMSKTVFCELFKAETKLSFKDYLNRKRIQKAMALIKDGENLTSIAELCGYKEFSTFYRNFIKFTNTTPGKYKTFSNKHY